MEAWEHILRIAAEFIVILWGLYITWRNRDKGRVLVKAEETIKRQRIEIVLQEERIEDLQAELKLKNEEITHHQSRSQSRKLRMQERIMEIKQLLGNSASSESILEALKDKGDPSDTAARLSDVVLDD